MIVSIKCCHDCFEVFHLFTVLDMILLNGPFLALGKEDIYCWNGEQFGLVVLEVGKLVG